MLIYRSAFGRVTKNDITSYEIVSYVLINHKRNNLATQHKIQLEICLSF